LGKCVDGPQDLISYEMISRRPFKVRECTKGTGGACGAIFLTEYFKELLVTKLGPKHIDVLTPKRIAEAVNSFENNIKFTFNPYSDDEEDAFEIPLPGAADIPEAKLQDGYILISRYPIVINPMSKLRKSILQHVFLPLFSKISNLVHEQVAEVKRLHSKDVKVTIVSRVS
jgi:hypothetical protein